MTLRKLRETQFLKMMPILALAGFKRIAPEQDTGMDLNEPWITALELFNAGE